MDIQKKNSNDLNAVLTVKLMPEDYQPKVDKSLQAYRKKADMPGFRKGMVPMGMVKKMVGQSALVEEINKILGEEINNYIKKNELDILGQPLPSKNQDDIDWKNQKEFEFDFDLGLAPDIKLDLDEKKYTKYNVKIDDKAIKSQMNDLAKRYGKVTTVDKSEKEDIIYGQFVELNDNEEIKEGGIMESSTILISSISDEKLQELFVGLQPEQKITIDIKEIWNEEDIAVRFKIDQERASIINNKFRLTVEKVNRMFPADINQELFDKIFGEGKVKSEEEFKAKVKEDLEEGLHNDTGYLLQRDIRDGLLKELKIDLPDDFLKRWITHANEKPIKQEELEKNYDDYAKSLKWQLIQNKVIKDSEIEVDWEAVTEHTKKLVKQQMLQYGRTDITEDELKQTADSVLTNKEETQKIYDDLYHQKTMETIEDKVTIDEKDISYDEFLEKAKAQ